MLKTKVVALSLALTFAVSYLVCVVWGLVMPASLHMHGFLELILPGFSWLSWPTFLLGLAESFLLGYLCRADFRADPQLRRST